MAVEVENATGWIEALIKGVSLAVTALFGWVWRTSHRQAQMEQQFADATAQNKQRMDERDKRLKSIERGVGRILNHLTGTNLHDV